MMRYWHVATRRYAGFDRLGDARGLRHAFSTRPDDVSARLDRVVPERDARRRQMAVDLGLASERLHWCVQAHETEMRLITAASGGGAQEAVDGLLTNAPGAPLMCFSADCPLVLLFDPRRRALGVAHASWRCTIARIVVLLLERMKAELGVRPEEIVAGIGPSAGPCCYEVQEDVRAAAVELPDGDRLFPRRDGRMFFDLWAANAAQLIAAGVPAGNIETAGVCTLCQNSIFYSFRREGPGCGHFGLMASLVDD